MPDQRSTTDQMVDVYSWAVSQGMYDAAEWLQRTYFGVPAGLIGDVQETARNDGGDFDA